MTRLLLALLLAWPLAAAGQPVFDAATFGVVANDDKGDGAAIGRAVAAAQAAGGGVVQLPPGRLHVWHLKLRDLKGLTLRGHGATGPSRTLLVRQRAKAPDRERILSIHGAEDFVLQDLAVDMNRLQQWGGIGVYACRRCTFERLHLFDATPYPYVTTPDRYALVFGFAGLDQAHEDLTLRHCRVEDLQVEIDHARRVRVEENWFIRGDFTAALGSFGLASGYVFEDVTIARNRFVNAARQGLTLQLDFRSHETVKSVIFRRILVEDNLFLYQTTVRQAPGLVLRVGMHDNSLATPGSVFEAITVQRNHISLAPGVPHASGPLLFGNLSGLSGWRFEGLTIRDNVQYANTPRRLVEVRRVPGDQVTLENNVTLPYRTPPKAPWPAVGAPVP